MLPFPFQLKEILSQAKWEQVKAAKEELILQANSIRKEREQLETSAKSKEDAVTSKAEQTLQKYKQEIQKLGKEISQLQLKADSSKIAALRRGVEENSSGKFTNHKTPPAKNEGHATNISEVVSGFHVKRDRECVMCLSEEMSVVFLPCAHQVVCTVCNELHEKQGMKDCPSCRSPIQRRIPIRYARS